jgi:hypothetical protein
MLRDRDTGFPLRLQGGFVGKKAEAAAISQARKRTKKFASIAKE